MNLSKYVQGDLIVKRATLYILIIFATIGFSLKAQDEYIDPCLVEDSVEIEATEEITITNNDDFIFRVILPEPRGDGAFIDSAAIGAERAIAELSSSGLIIETRSTELPINVPMQVEGILSAVADNPDLIVLVGIYAPEISEVLDSVTDIPFAAIETFFDEENPYENLSIFNILTHENSYLAGMAAGMLSRTGKVGVVGGLDIDPINLFIVGFEEGVLSVCSDCEVVINYIGTPEYQTDNAFGDIPRGRAVATEMYANGVDIIYQVAGQSGIGVLEVAEETGNFAIGVDLNQDDLYPGTVIVSAMKRIDIGVYNLVEAALNDEYMAGEVVVGMAEGFTGLSWDEGICSRTFDEFGPEDMVEKLPSVRQAIAEARVAILSNDLIVTNIYEQSE